MVVQFAFGDCEPKGINYTPELIPLSNPNAYLLPIGYLATESVTSVLANNAYVLKGDACKCESEGYLRRMQAEARKARVGVSESDLVEHAPWTMIEPIQPHVAGLFRFQATVGALASVFNGGEVLAGVVPASEIGSNQFAKELIGRNSIVPRCPLRYHQGGVGKHLQVPHTWLWQQRHQLASEEACTSPLPLT